MSTTPQIQKQSIHFQWDINICLFMTKLLVKYFILTTFTALSSNHFLILCKPIPSSITWLEKKFFKATAAAAKSLQSCSTLCDPIDGSPPSSPVPGILQARTLEWVTISFSSAWKWKVKVKSLSRVQLLATPWTLTIVFLPPNQVSLNSLKPSRLLSMNWMIMSHPIIFYLPFLL